MTRKSTIDCTKTTASTAAAGASFVRGFVLQWPRYAGHLEGSIAMSGNARQLLPLTPRAPNH
jgi:hypothetical protein